MYSDKRTNNRERTDPINVNILCKIANANGYITSLSKSGAKIHIEHNVDDIFNISFDDTNNLQDSLWVLKAKKIWEKEDPNYPGISIIGCQFNDITPEKKDFISQLMSYYRKKKRIK